MKTLFLFLFLNNLFANNFEELFNSFYSIPGLNSSIWAIKVSYTDGKEIFSFNENKNLIPASILKIFVTSAALDILGPDYRFKTVLYYTGKIKNGILYGDIAIEGKGDMTLGSENFDLSPELVFENWLKALKEKGIKEIKGNIIVDDTILNEIQPGSWAWEDIGNYYAAPFSALSINDNLYKIFFETGKKEGDKTRFLKFEPQVDLKIKNEVTTGAQGSGDNAYIYTVPWSKEIIVRGTLPPGKSSFFIKGSIGDGALFCGELFFKYLSKKGFKVSGKVIKKQIYREKFNSIYEISSPPVKEIIKITNKKSFNFYAEMLLRFLAYRDSGKAGLKYGFEKLNEFLRKCKVDVNDIYLADASGLSRVNSVKASDFIKVLNFVSSQEYFKDFYDSLVYPGDNQAKGHVRSIGVNKSFKDGLRIKTGSLKNVRAYAGYLFTKNGKQISFCSILNNYSINPQKIDSIHDELFSFLYENY